MSELKKNITAIQCEWNKLIAAVATHQELEALRIAYIGKRGHVTQLFAQLSSLSLEEKRVCGPTLNDLKNQCDLDVKKKSEELTITQQQADAHSFDFTAYPPHLSFGSLHPYTHFIHEVHDIFLSMGFDLLEGPEVETDYYNFTALNIPPDHPARDMYDTFWLNQTPYLMRTHTSTVQIRAMQKKALPFAGICTGRVFRHEAVDASHDHTFMQGEGILIDKKVSLAHLFGVIKEFIGALFCTDKPNIRIRPGFFPFVEPGFEIDMQCPFCSSGCGTCKRTRWIEVFPGGLIHPNVLKEAGINSRTHSGFAFCFGLTRLAMLKYGIRDIRLLHSGKIGFLTQFR